MPKRVQVLVEVELNDAPDYEKSYFDIEECIGKVIINQLGDRMTSNDDGTSLLINEVRCDPKTGRFKVL